MFSCSCYYCRLLCDTRRRTKEKSTKEKHRQTATKKKERKMQKLENCMLASPSCSCLSNVNMRQARRIAKTKTEAAQLAMTMDFNNKPITNSTHESVWQQRKELVFQPRAAVVSAWDKRKDEKSNFPSFVCRE